ncbi:metallophosphoesterase family protein [Mucilaginibacter ginsenosidivorax]|uniref:Metallophosphoesterase family protein n=1 Tax=Mucilaginibacter ginsenosidivorax TaxID=862126 RepID=A0A5B8W256_9SPHI|nr:metallophosphoesterase family protein [Mucilaginibacter ginsenosidivorax]QEC77012.1 metallophosphoesterase family protein [Mucilaginibacter ginsenosidivorax]
MKIALFSDVHANLPAFEAFLNDLDSRRVDTVYCLGDLVGYNVWPNEVIAQIRKRGIATLAGNHDLKPKKMATTAQSLTEPGKSHAYHLINDENRKYLATLPAHIRLEFKLTDGPLNVMLAHGSTRSVDEYVLEDFDEAYVLAMMDEANADILCVGHSHKPYHRVIKASDQNFKHVINIGSVGKPKDGNPDVCYVILSLNKKSGVSNNNGIHVEFIRTSYDVETAAAAIEKSPLPDEFADRLRKAY